LIERGRKFVKLALGAHYKSYTGNMFLQSWGGCMFFKADGRVMVDGGAFNKCNPNYQGFRMQHNQYLTGSIMVNDGTSVSSFTTLSDDLLFSTWPTVPGFSFSSKRWGEIIVEKTAEVKFDEDAYERLVLPPEKKLLIQALVENSKKSFSDIITGKGGGCIFLLHGSPGVGKTLTAEAIAEMLHRPLYSVSVGELGTTTTQLESTLSQILEVAAGWNAVVLIDEADIFLEARSENDIIRNAMVGIFLKLLEYHQGVLFLTTNRVKCFDEAFHSRISVALKYDDLDEESRGQVWINLLEAAGIDYKANKVDINVLRTAPLNGRQIRSVIRLAQSLAFSEKQTVVTSAHFSRCVSIARVGTSDFIKSHST